jgi:hypothetical protein
MTSSDEGSVTSRPIHAAAEQQPLIKIGAVPIHRTDEVVLIEVSQILYFFLGSAASRHMVDARWTGQTTLHPARIYLRTEDGLYRVHSRAIRSIDDLLRRLPGQFLQVNQGAAVNETAATNLELRGRYKRIGIRLPDRGNMRVIEWVRVTRDFLGAVRERFATWYRRKRET